MEIHHRRSVRLKEYDYSEPGGYFVTVCSYKQENWLGEIIDNEMVLNEMGKIAMKCWREIPDHFPNVELDEFIIMPNHLHGIVIITDKPQPHSRTDEQQYRRGVMHYAPTGSSMSAPGALRSPTHTVGAIVRGFKSAVTKRINILRDMPGVPVWQRNFYEHIIRDDGSLSRIREYIRNNPAKWEKDRNNMLENGHKSTTEIDWSEIKQMVAMCPDCLSPRENRLIEMRYGLKDGVPMTLQQIGDIFGFTRERARQIEKKAIRKLKHPTRVKKLKQFISMNSEQIFENVKVNAGIKDGVFAIE